MFSVRYTYCLYLNVILDLRQQWGITAFVVWSYYLAEVIKE